MTKREFLRQTHSPQIIQPNKRKKAVSSNVIALSKVQPIDLSLLSINGSTVGQSFKEHQPIKTPRSETDSTSSIVHSYSSVNMSEDNCFLFEIHPLLADAKDADVSELFIKKCKMCNSMCNFLDKNHKQAIDDKSAILNEIMGFVSYSNQVSNFGKSEYSSIIHLFLRNIERSPPLPKSFAFLYNDTDGPSDQYEEASWPHLSMVYDIIIEFLSNRRFAIRLCSVNDLRNLINAALCLFRSPDSRERDKLSKLFHIMYRTFNDYRGIIRNIVASFLQASLELTRLPFGISEILIAYCSVVSGFRMPLLQEHQDFYKKYILPLHSHTFLKFFHQQLVSIVCVFCDKQLSFAVQTISDLINRWPVISPSKQILFISEIQHLIERIRVESASYIIVRLCRLISYCLQNSSFAVIERTLMMWESEQFLRVLSHYGATSLSIVIPAMYQVAMTHWCDAVKKLALTALQVLRNSNSSVFEVIGPQLKRIESDRVLNQMKRANAWKNLIDNSTLDDNSRLIRLTEISIIFIGCEELKPKNIKELRKSV